jgi:hypothetical protein
MEFAVPNMNVQVERFLSANLQVESFAVFKTKFLQSKEISSFKMLGPGNNQNPMNQKIKLCILFVFGAICFYKLVTLLLISSKTPTASKIGRMETFEFPSEEEEAPVNVELSEVTKSS